MQMKEKKLESPHYKDIVDVYGLAYADGSNQIVYTPPFEFRIAWNPKYTVGRFLIHGLVEKSLNSILCTIMDEYGVEKIEEFKINYFGGSYSYRKSRLSNRFSTHAWGVAIDLAPYQNLLKLDKTKSLFANPQYNKMMEIFYDYGWYNEGRELGTNWGHFQAVSYK